MARIHRILTLLSVLLYFVAYINAAATVNSINGPVAQGAQIFITYVITGTPPAKINLQVINLNTKDAKVINDNLPVSPPSFPWVVDVPVGTYYFAINDGSGQAFSSNFDVSAGTLPPSTTPTTPAAATPAPAPPAPAASAATPATSASASASAAASDSPKASTPAATTPASASANSATSFSGYSLLVSLAVVAAVMFHLA
jgi:hypothetical protein